MDAIATKIGKVLPRTYEGVFVCAACGHPSRVSQPNEQELVEPVSVSKLMVVAVGRGIRLNSINELKNQF